MERDEVLLKKNFVLKKSKETKETPRNLHIQTHATTGEAVLAQSQNYEAFRQHVNRERNDEAWHTKSPPDLSQIDIPDELKNTLRGMTFYYDDSGSEDPERIILFTTDSNIEVYLIFIVFYLKFKLII